MLRLAWSRQFKFQSAATGQNHRSLDHVAAVDFVCHQFLARPGLAQDEHGGFRRGDHVNLVNNLSQCGTLANQIAERFGLNHRFLQVSVLKFQLGLEGLDLLKGPRIGDGSPQMISKDPPPGQEFLLKQFACGRNYKTPGFYFVLDRIKCITADLLFAHPFGIERGEGLFV